MQEQHDLKDTHLLRKSKSQTNETVQLDKISVRRIYLSLPSLTSLSGWSSLSKLHQKSQKSSLPPP